MSESVNSTTSVNKIKHSHTYKISSNYWTPLATIIEEEENKEEDEDNETDKGFAASAIDHRSRDKNEMMIVDSGASSHFATESIDLAPTGIPSTKEVFLPDGSTIKGSETAKLPFPTLPERAKKVDVLPQLQKSLLSVGILADEGYTTVFHPRDQGVTIHEEGTLLLIEKKPAEIQGWRAETGLWEMGITDAKKTETPTPEQDRINNICSTTDAKKAESPTREQDRINNVYSLPSIPGAIKYLHAATGFPPKSTWLAAIKAGNFVTWPGITVESVSKHFPESEETLKGHMKLQRMNVRSTKKIEANEDIEDIPVLSKHKKGDVFISVFNAHDTVYTDQTGGFPVTSSRGNKYVMVMCEVDGNYIDAEPMKSRTTDSLVKTYLILWKRLTSSKVITPKLHILDNEAPAELKEVIRNNCKMQLVPPDTHRSNLAERAIQTFKRHFISILSGVDENFPLHLWDRLLPQAILTLNLLRQSNVAPTVSAYQYVNGPFDYNAMPLGPMGCAVQIFNSPNRRESWEERSLDGWYLQTSPEHYRCHRIYVKKTRDERVSNTVTFKHRHITQPTVTPADVAIQAIKDLTKVMKSTTTVSNDESEFEALKKLEVLVTNKLTVPNQKRDKVANPSALDESIITKKSTPPPRVTSDGPASNTRARAQQLTDLDMAMCIIEQTPTASPNTREYANVAVLHPDTGRQMTYRQLIKHPLFADKWNHSSANEFGRLAQGIGGRIKGTDTIRFVRKDQVPADRLKDVTYAQFVCELKPNKTEVERTRLVCGGDKVNYPGEVGTPTADMLLVKTHLNSVISTPNARYMTLDISNFYLNTPMIRFEYIRIKLEDIPEEVIVEYGLREIATPDGYVYVEVRKGMYGLPQAGLLAQELLEKRLGEHGYTQSKIIPGLWKHETSNVTFTLIVDDFGVKYVRKGDVDHLISILKKSYDITEDWTGSKYIGLTLDWDYNRGKVHLSMPGYIDKALERFDHKAPSTPQNSPYPHTKPQYGAKIQYATDEDATPVLGKEEKKFIQQVTGTLLYYARAVDSTLLTPLSAIASQQAAPTVATMEKVRQILDYVASQEEAVLTFNASKMILAVHSDAGYLNEPNA